MPRSHTGSNSHAFLSQEWRALAREFDLGGAILFSRNVEAPEQVEGAVTPANSKEDERSIPAGADTLDRCPARSLGPHTD